MLYASGSLNLKQYYQSDSCVGIPSISLMRVRYELSNEGTGMKILYCIQRKAAWIFNGKSMKYKIDVSGENPPTFELHWYSRGLPGCGAKFGVISVSCIPPCHFSRARSVEFLHSRSLPHWQVFYSVLF